MDINTPETEEYFPDKTDAIFRKKSIKFSIACIAVAILIAAVSYIAINYSSRIFDNDLDIFDTAPETSLILGKIEDGLIGGDIKVGIRACSIEEDSITVVIYGNNYSDDMWTADQGTFVISGFNTEIAENRQHYYPDGFDGIDVKANGQFVCQLVFPVERAKEKSEDGYKFTLSAFRDSDVPTVEIELENTDVSVN